MQAGIDIAVVFKLAKETMKLLTIKDITPRLNFQVIPDFIGDVQDADTRPCRKANRN